MKCSFVRFLVAPQRLDFKNTVNTKHAMSCGKGHSVTGNPEDLLGAIHLMMGTYLLARARCFNEHVE